MKDKRNTSFILRVIGMLVGFAATTNYIYLARDAWVSEERKHYQQLEFPIGQMSMLAFVGYSEIVVGLVLIETIDEPAMDTIVTILLTIGAVVNFITSISMVDFIYQGHQSNLWFTCAGFALINTCLMLADLFIMIRNKV